MKDCRHDVMSKIHLHLGSTTEIGNFPSVSTNNYIICSCSSPPRSGKVTDKTAEHGSKWIILQRISVISSSSVKGWLEEHRPPTRDRIKDDDIRDYSLNGGIVGVLYTEHSFTTTLDYSYYFHNRSLQTGASGRGNGQRIKLKSMHSWGIGTREGRVAL